jgi:hypothetical protein
MSDALVISDFTKPGSVTVRDKEFTLSGTDSDVILGTLLLGKAGEAATNANKLAEQIKAERSGQDSRKQELIENSDDPQIVKVRENIAKLNAQLEKQTSAMEELIAGLLSNERMSDEELNAKVEEYKSYKQAFSTQAKMLEAHANDAEVTGLADAVAYLKEAVTGVRNTSGSANSGSNNGEGTKRPRVGNVNVDGVADFKTFTLAAQAAGVTANAISAKWLEVAGTNVWQDIKDDVTFSLNGHNIVVTPKAKSDASFTQADASTETEITQAQGDNHPDETE